MVAAHRRDRAQLNELRAANRNGKVKRTDLIAAVLEGTPGLTVRQLIAGLNQKFARNVHREQPHWSFVYQSKNVHSYRGSSPLSGFAFCSHATGCCKG
jgi:hypothetical protein